MSVKVLSTKKLGVKQELLIGNFNLKQASFIDITIDKNINDIPTSEYYLISSKNSVFSLIENNLVQGLQESKVICIGNNTRNILQQNGINPIICANDSDDLIKEIGNYSSIKSLCYLSGNLFRNELIDSLISLGMNVEIRIMYNTYLLNRKCDSKFDAVMFFSPSAVKSYIKGGNSNSVIAFCIGKTSAIEARKYFENVFYPTIAKVENVIKLLNEYFENEKD